MNPVKNSPVFLKLVTADSIAANWVIYLSVNEAILSSIFIISSLYSVIDSAVSLIGDAQERNYQRWPILNQYVWPNAFVGGDYLSEINYLKSWISDRIQWMDQQFLD